MVVHDYLTPCSKAEPCPQCRLHDLTVAVCWCGSGHPWEKAKRYNIQTGRTF